MAVGKNLVEVGVAMVLQDQFSTTAGRISGSYAKLLNDMNTYNRGISMSVGKAFETGTQMISGMYEAYRHSAEVQDQIFLTSKIAGATVKQQKELMKLTQEVNTRTPLTNIDISSGMKYLAMAGNSADAIQEMIGPAAELASIFSMELGGKGGVADMMTNIMATFGIASNDARKTADILGVATTSANISLTDLAQSLQYSGATFRNAGVDLKTAAAAIGVLGDQGIQASSAGTALANMMRYLTLSVTGQKAKGTDMLKALGISHDDLVDSYGNLKRLDVLMKVMADRMQGLSGTAREQAMYNIFGVRGQRAAAALMQDVWTGNNKLTSIMNKLDTSGGFTEGTTEDRLKTSQGIIDMFNSSIDNLRVSAGAIFGSLFNPILGAISKISNWVSNLLIENPFIKWITSAGAVAITVGTIVNGIKLAWRTISMVGTATQAASSASNAMATGIGRANANAMALEGHLRIIVGLMARSAALSMAPGTSLNFGGNIIGKGAKGKPYYFAMDKNGKRSGRYNDVGKWANAYYIGGPTKSSSSVGGPTITPNPSRIGKFGSILKGAGGMALGLMGGWWGLALTGISVALPLILGAVNRNKDSVDENTDATKRNTNEMSAGEFRAHYEEKFINALKTAMKTKDNDPMKLAISVNGNPYTLRNNGDILDIDTWGTY